MEFLDNALVEEIKARYESAQERIVRTAQSAGRDPNDVRLVVVTKAQPVEVVRAVISAGARILGENYPEETALKSEEIGEIAHLQWHMIGHLQSRKVKYVVEHFDMMHSLDSLRLAEKLDRSLGEAGKRLPVLLEVNVGNEASKHGWDIERPEDFSTFCRDIESILQLPHLNVRGIMGMPPLPDRPEDARPYFVQIRELRDRLAGIFKEGNWDELSMGTSSDYEVAVQEGATLVRVGEAIVGPRRYND